MMYAILVMILLFLVGYVLARWLRMVFAEGRDAAREALHVARGGKTPRTLIEDARVFFAREDCEVEFVAASTQAGHVTDNLMRKREDDAVPDMGIGLLFTLAIDVSGARLYLRGIEFRAGGEIEEFERSHGFSEVVAIDQVENPFPPSLVPEVGTALRIVVDDGRQHVVCLPLERAWRIRASDLVSRVRGMIEDGQKPEVTPVIVQ